jgi:hypothetical protein
MSFLAQYGDNAIEEGYGDDENADKRLVCVLHGKWLYLC